MVTLLLIGPFKGDAEKFVTGFPSTYRVNHALTAKEGLDFLDSKSAGCTAVLLDLSVEDEDALSVLQKVKSKHPMIEVITLSAILKPKWAIEVMRLGGYAFETYEATLEMMEGYITQIFDQFNLFTLAETFCRNRMTEEMDVRLSVALEFLIKRRFEGHPLSIEELSVFFPIGNSEEATDALQKLQRHFDTNDTEKQNKPRVLVVEDEALVSDMLQALLIGVLHYDVVLAKSKSEALALIDNEDFFQVAILDIGLPDGHGIDLIKPLLNKNADTQVIMLTAFKDLEMITQSFKWGAVDYMTKPFQGLTFQQVVSKAVQRSIYKAFIPQSPNSLVLRYSDNTMLRIDMLKEFVAMRQKKNKDVHSREMALFLPCFRQATSYSSQGLDTATMNPGVAPFILAFCESLHVHMSVEEERLLLK